MRGGFWGDPGGRGITYGNLCNDYHVREFISPKEMCVKQHEVYRNYREKIRGEEI